VPHATAEDVRDQLIALRKKHPTWGPKKLLALMRKSKPKRSLPAASTVGELLKEAGLVAPRRKKRRVRGLGWNGTKPAAPNHVWCADFKGDFRLRNGKRCYPLTITDLYTRMILACVALPAPTTESARAVFERVFRRYGLPDVIRTDNGVPFATTNGIRGVSVLNVWWLRLGIRHERIEPGHPEQNGAHERMHRTLKAEAVFPTLSNIAAQQRRFDRFRRSFNGVRPHEAIGQLAPSDLYKPSKRQLPKRLPELRYPPNMEVRTVTARGYFSFAGHLIWVSEALYKQRLGIEQTDWRRWRVYLGPILLGEIDEKFELIDALSAPLRKAA
jgi:transposase InsO family protein